MLNLKELIGTAKIRMEMLESLKEHRIVDASGALERLQCLGTLIAVPTISGPSEPFPMPWDAGFELDGEDLTISGTAGSNGFGVASVTIPIGEGGFRGFGYRLEFTPEEGNAGEERDLMIIELLLEMLEPLGIHLLTV